VKWRIKFYDTNYGNWRRTGLMSLYDAKRMARYLQKVHGEVEVYLDDLDSSQPGVRIKGGATWMN
jgi:hypothetical protein